MATATTISMPEFWQRLSVDSQTAFRQAGGCKTKDDGTAMQACEAREIHGQLPNSALEVMPPEQLALAVATDFKDRYGVDCLVAIHYNKTKTNLHYHVMFPERQLLEEPVIQVADRNVFLDADGIRKRTKKEITDADGQLLPGCSIIKKGEVLSARYFGNKNPMFAEKSWMNEYRHTMADWINENLHPDELRTVFDRNGPYLAQVHIGKGTPAPKRLKMEEWNALTKEFNYIVDVGGMTHAEAREFKTRIELSPDRNQELKAVLAELYREAYPDDTDRATWDKIAAQAATTPLSPAVENRQEKQELRELYKAHGKARAAVVDAPSEIDATIRKAEADSIARQIDGKKAQLGIVPELRKVQEVGRLAGVNPKDVGRLYKAANRMTGDQWRQVWADCKTAQSQFWEGYRVRKELLLDEKDDAYKRRRQVKNAEWALDPRNRRKSLLGVLYAFFVLAKNGSLEQWDDEIARIKREETALRRQMQQFKAATGETYDTLHKRGLSPDKYLTAVKRMQRLADQVTLEMPMDLPQSRGLEYSN